MTARFPSTPSRGIGSHQSAAMGTDEWLTPPWLLQAVGGAESFDLDPCAPILRPWSMAREHLTIQDDGLARAWGGRVWLNPPYGDAMAVWMARLARHGDGLGLIFARTETEAFHATVWPHASAVLFLKGRLHFHRPEAPDPARCLSAPHVWTNCAEAGKMKVCAWCGMAKANGGAPSVLVAYGPHEMDRMAAMNGVPGRFVPLRLPRAVVVAILDSTWREAVAGVVAANDGPVRLDDLYRAMARHPKAKNHRHWREKVRQTLQRGGFRRIDRGLYALEGEAA